MSAGIRRLVRRQEGIAMVLALATVVMMMVIGTVVMKTLTDEQTHTQQTATKDGAYQAAEAGINDYSAKLLEDPLYDLHYRHPFESTRRGTDGTTVGAGAAWTGATACNGTQSPWTYPNGKDAWSGANTVLGGGYEYNLEVSPACAGDGGITIVSTGRPMCTPEAPTACTNRADWRAIEVRLRQASITDFQMLAAADIAYGPGATTHGLIYAGVDPVNPNILHTVRHDGVAYGDIMAEGGVSGSYQLRDGAQVYDRTTTPSIRTKIRDPINFADFLASLGDVKRAAQNGGIYLNDTTSGTTPDAWRLTFEPSGLVLVQPCTSATSRRTKLDPAAAEPGCGAVVPYPVPANGAVYAEQDAIVSGTVNGRVTVASAKDIVVGGDISYVQTGDDVLGLIGTDNVFVAHWAPPQLTWRAATLAENGQWRAWDTGRYPSEGRSSSMTFIGSTATRNGGSMAGAYASRTYEYDDSLRYLPPPWFPTIDNSFTVIYSREVVP